MKNEPPRLALKFFRWYCHPTLADRIEGDLLEDYGHKVKTLGKRKADIRFIIDVILLCRRGIVRPVEGAQKLNTYGMYKSYLKIGWRNALKSKVHSLINTGGLSIGMAATLLIFLYLKDEYRYDTFHQDAANTYRITTDWVRADGSVKTKEGNTGYLQGPKFKDAIPEVVAAVRWQREELPVKIENEVRDVQMFRTDPNFFSVFSFPLLSGNMNQVLKEPRSIVVTQEKARMLFNTTEAVGRTLDVKVGDNFETFTVTGVAQNVPSHSSIAFDYVIPFEIRPEEYTNKDNWFNTFLNTFLVLHPSADPRLVEQKMKQAYETDAKETIAAMREKYSIDETARYQLQPLLDLHLSQEYKADNGLRDASNPMYGYILSGIAIFILLIACINFINLSIARSLKRAKEIGVRKVVGGNRWSLAIQFMTESYLLCLFSFVIALALVQLSLPLFNQLAQKAITIGSTLDATLALASMAVFLATGFIAGFYPALVLSGFNPSKILYARFRFSGNNLFQKGLVVVQFSLAAFLIMATLTIYSQFEFMMTTDLGYDAKNLVDVQRYPLSRTEFETFKNSLLQHSAIQAVSPKNGGDWGTVAKVNGEQQIEFQYNIVDHTYLPMMKISMAQGRNFSPDFPSDNTEAILVNEAFVREAEWKDPLGQQVNFWYRNNKKYTVIGVVKNYHFNSLSHEIRPQLFIISPENNFGRALIRLTGTDNAGALAHVKKVFKAQFPDYSYSHEFVEENNRQMYQLEARWKQIVLFASILTIFISCIGLFGLAALAAERRTKEIGIRKVLGASVSSITGLLSGNFVKLVALAFVLAVPIAYFASSEWLSTYAYRVSFSIRTVAITCLITLLIAALTVSVQAIRSALMNPVNSLRSE